MRKSSWMTAVAVAVALSMPHTWAQGATPANKRAAEVKPPAKTSPQRMKVLTVTEGEFHCKGPTGNNNFVKCTDIPVIVLLKSTGGCIVHVPYHDLVAHSKKVETLLTWNLIAPTNYKFHATKGIEIPNPGTTFKEVGINAQGTKYSWKVIANAAALSTNHIANAVDPSGNSCEQGDPTITNDPT